METNTANTALLVMDMQAAIVGNLPDPAPVKNNVAKAIAHARSNKIPVIYVVLGFREGTPEISASNRMFTSIRERFAGIRMSDLSKVDPSVEPQEGDVIVTKRRVSAFTGSDLEVVLRAMNVKHIVLTGVATGGVVLSTTREAADKDYMITVLSDGCADGDEEVHRVLMTKVLARQAEVMTVAEWCK